LSLATKISIIIFTLAVSLLMYGNWAYHKYDWITARQTINVSAHGKYEIIFRSQMNANYELSLSTERNLETTEQSCRLSIETIKKDECHGHTEILAIEWSVLEGDGTKISSGSSKDSKSGFYAQKKMGKTLDVFRTEKDKKYKIIAEIMNIDPPLAVTNPTLELLIGRMEHKRAFIHASLVGFASLFLTGLAVLIWVCGFFYRRFRKKQRQCNA